MNAIYVISGFYIHPRAGTLLLTLVGVKNVDTPTHSRSDTFGVWRFRLLDHMQELARTRQQSEQKV